MKFTDATGRRWTIQDYRVAGRAKKPVPFGSYDGAGRAFIPDGWDGPVLLHRWGYVEYREERAPKFLEAQLAAAKPVTATAGERLQTSSPPESEQVARDS